jgi:hypothetical protein
LLQEKAPEELSSGLEEVLLGFSEQVLKRLKTCTDSVRIESLPGSQVEIGYRARDALLSKY